MAIAKRIGSNFVKLLFFLVFGVILPVCLIVGTFNNLCYKSPDICSLVQETALYSIAFFCCFTLFIVLPVWFIANLNNNVYSNQKA